MAWYGMPPLSRGLACAPAGCDNGIACRDERGWVRGGRQGVTQEGAEDLPAPEWVLRQVKLF